MDILTGHFHLGRFDSGTFWLWDILTLGRFDLGRFDFGTFWPVCSQKMFPFSSLVKYSENILGTFWLTKNGTFWQITWDVLVLGRFDRIAPVVGPITKLNLLFISRGSVLVLFLVQVRLRTEVPSTQSSTIPGLNSWPPDHDSTVHVAEMPALTTRPWVTSYSSCHWDACSNHQAISDFFLTHQNISCLFADCHPTKHFSFCVNQWTFFQIYSGCLSLNVEFKQHTAKTMFYLDNVMRRESFVQGNYFINY